MTDHVLSSYTRTNIVENVNGLLVILLVIFCILNVVGNNFFQLVENLLNEREEMGKRPHEIDEECLHINLGGVYLLTFILVTEKFALHSEQTAEL